MNEYHTYFFLHSIKICKPKRSIRLYVRKNHSYIVLRRELMSIGIVTHDAAPIYVTGEGWYRTGYYFYTTEQNL